MRFACPFCLWTNVAGQLECNCLISLICLRPWASFQKAASHCCELPSKPTKEEAITTRSVFVDVGKELDAIFYYLLLLFTGKADQELHRGLFQGRKFLFFSHWVVSRVKHRSASWLATRRWHASTVLSLAPVGILSCLYLSLWQQNILAKCWCVLSKNKAQHTALHTQSCW